MVYLKVIPMTFLFFVLAFVLKTIFPPYNEEYIWPYLIPVAEISLAIGLFIYRKYVDEKFLEGKNERQLTTKNMYLLLVYSVMITVSITPAWMSLFPKSNIIESNLILLIVLVIFLVLLYVIFLRKAYRNKPETSIKKNRE